jgi:hypothetical protein
MYENYIEPAIWKIELFPHYLVQNQMYVGGLSYMYLAI